MAYLAERNKESEDFASEKKKNKNLVGGEKMRIKRIIKGIIFAVAIYYLKQKEQRTIKQAEEFWDNGDFLRLKKLMDGLDRYTKKRWELSDFP